MPGRALAGLGSICLPFTVCGVAFSTASIASLAVNVTKPKPLDFPVVGSVLMLTSTTTPNFEKYSRRSLLSVSQLMPPTKSFLEKGESLSSSFVLESEPF
uniref:Putative secreted protein n=1 Tax=Ixodes ricinus TaxID=34613 RepID=A0A6B0UEI4_IXORI